MIEDGQSRRFRNGASKWGYGTELRGEGISKAYRPGVSPEKEGAYRIEHGKLWITETWEGGTVAM